MLGNAAALLLGAATATSALDAPTGLSSSHPRVVLRHRPEGAPFEGVELHYFCLRGLGELPRLMLEVTGTAYDSVMYFDTKEYKDIGPFGQMPLLKDPPNLGGHLGTGGWLPQSSTIVRHIARVNGLDAPDDPLRQARIDFIFEGSKDIAGKKAIAHLTSDDGSQDFARGHTYLRNATTLLGEEEWWAGPEGMSYADVAMFAALHGLEEIKPGAFAIPAYGVLPVCSRLLRHAVLPPAGAPPPPPATPTTHARLLLPHPLLKTSLLHGQDSSRPSGTAPSTPSSNAWPRSRPSPSTSPARAASR